MGGKREFSLFVLLFDDNSWEWSTFTFQTLNVKVETKCVHWSFLHDLLWKLDIKVLSCFGLDYFSNLLWLQLSYRLCHDKWFIQVHLIPVLMAFSSKSQVEVLSTYCTKSTHSFTLTLNAYPILMPAYVISAVTGCADEINCIYNLLSSVKTALHLSPSQRNTALVRGCLPFFCWAWHSGKFTMPQVNETTCSSFPLVILLSYSYKNDKQTKRSSP